MYCQVPVKASINLVQEKTIKEIDRLGIGHPKKMENLCVYPKVACFWSNRKSRTKISKSRSFLGKVRDFPHFYEFADTVLYEPKLAKYKTTICYIGNKVLSNLELDMVLN